MERDIQGHKALAQVLSVKVPNSWPPDLYGARAMQFALSELAEAAEKGWAFWYLMRRQHLHRLLLRTQRLLQSSWL